jgi:hypothetical protein
MQGGAVLFEQRLGADGCGLHTVEPKAAIRPPT